jgi:hypothetical protein
MAFLDNSGDIILDAVLTDTGRFRLAKGDGSFKIAKFALGDDEIDYSLYNKDHPSGSAYYDLDILQTPVLEALTDNASALKSHLLTINQTDLLFLPVLRLFDTDSTSATFGNNGYFIVVADQTTETTGAFNASTKPNGVFFTQNKQNTANHVIAIDQGLDTTKITPAQELSPDLVESMYLLEFDNRLGRLHDPAGTFLNPSYVDDDQIATYLVSIQKNPNMISNIEPTQANGQPTNSSINGPRGTRLKLKLSATEELQTSTFLFEELGSTWSDSGVTFYSIDTHVRVTGATTGYRLDIPVRIVKYKSTP